MLHLNLLRLTRTKLSLFTSSGKALNQGLLLAQPKLADPLKFLTKNLHNSNQLAFFSTSMSSSYSSGYSNVDQSGEKIMISNPSEIKSRKILTDLYVKPRMTLGEFRDIIPISDQEFESSLQTLGVSNDPNYIMKQDEMEILALEHDFLVVTKRSTREELPLRPPIMTIMGHVDHGKTTLLDSLRNSNIAEGEYGGITQKIGAFMVKTKEGKTITFIDTPGHEAFSNMRKRGSLSTDIVILVVSALDGCQPQTFEAIEHARNAGVPIIVAVNKIDQGGNPEEVEKELYDYGLNVEPHGGNVPVIHISAKFKKNIDLLEELILFEAELMDLRADPTCAAEGIVLETKRTAENETKACTIIVQKGTLKVGDFVIAGCQYGRIKQIKDDKGVLMEEAPPSSAVEIVGLKDLPENGEMIVAISSGEKAKIIATRRKMNREARERLENQEPIIMGQKIKFSNWRERRKFHSGSKEIIMDKMTDIENTIKEKIEIAQQKEGHEEELLRLEQELEAHYLYVQEMVEGRQDEDTLKVILKAQDKGTLETLVDQINKLAAKYEAKVDILDSGVGNITEAEIHDAKHFGALILAMDVVCPFELGKMAQAEKVQIKSYKIIYDILDELSGIFKRGGLSKPEIQIHGTASIKQIFEIKADKKSKEGKKVAGIIVNSGQFTRKYKYRLIRGGKIFKDNLEVSSLKHLKGEVNELKKGKEGGITLFDFNTLMEGDQLEAYELVKATEVKKS